MTQLQDQSYDPSSIFVYQLQSINTNTITNYLMSQCVEKMELLNKFIENNVSTLNQVNGSQYVIQFHLSDKTKRIQQYQDIQQKKFQLKHYYVLDFVSDPSDDDVSHDYINAFAQSENGQLLACCQFNYIFIWKLIEQQPIKRIEHTGFIYSIVYYSDSKNFIVGDEKGIIAKFNSLNQSKSPSLCYQVHKSIITQMIIKELDLIYSCSTDNTIKLTDLFNSTILLVIENQICCLSGFEYSSNRNFLIAPNDKQQLNLWDASNGQQVTSTNYHFQEKEFISVFLSLNQEKILLSLQEQQKIIIFEVQIKDNLFSLIPIKQLNLERKCYCSSWCLDDQAIIYYMRGDLRIRFLGLQCYPIIEQFQFMSSCQLIQQPFRNKLDNNLNQMLIPSDRSVYIYERVPRQMRNQF